MEIISKIEKYGLFYIFKILLNKMFKIDIRKYHYLRIKLDRNSLKSQLKDFDLNVKELSYDDFLLGFKDEFYGKKLEIIKNRFKDPTYKAFGLVDNGILIYSAWISLSMLGLPIKSNIFLRPTEGYLEDDFCHPDFRGRGIHGKMNLFRLYKLSEEGKDYCVVVVLHGNSIALNSHLNLGARNLGNFTGGKIFGIPFLLLNKSKYDSK
jgi:hypothetical protein